MDHAYGTPCDDEILRVITVNTLNGGIDPDGGTSRMDMTVAAIRDWQPDIVLAQELRGPAGVARGHFRSWANALGMEAAALGPPRGSKEQRCGIFTERSVVKVIEDGPADVHDRPGWAEAIVRVAPAGTDGAGTELGVISDHAQATTAQGQLLEAERQAARCARHLSIVGGDRNNYPPELADDELAWVRDHMPQVSSARLRCDDDGNVTGNYAVHRVLTLAGLADPVPLLSRDRRFPEDPGGTGSGPGRIDRFYLTASMLPAVRCYHQSANPGSDHQMLMLCLDLRVLEGIAEQM